jgi:hypothetical protein
MMHQIREPLKQKDPGGQYFKKCPGGNDACPGLFFFVPFSPKDVEYGSGSAG